MNLSKVTRSANPSQPSQRLTENLEASYRPKPPGDYEAHHIVPEGDPRATELQEFLENKDIDINSSDNGTWLPRGDQVPNPEGAFRHEFTFPDKYFETLRRILIEENGDASSEEIRDLLRRIGHSLENGRFPNLD